MDDGALDIDAACVTAGGTGRVAPVDEPCSGICDSDLDDPVTSGGIIGPDADPRGADVSLWSVVARGCPEGGAFAGLGALGEPCPDDWSWVKDEAGAPRVDAPSRVALAEEVC